MRSILNSFGPWVLWQLAPGQGWGYSTGRGGAKPIFLSLDPAKKPLPGPGRGGGFSTRGYLAAGPLVFLLAQYPSGPAHEVRVILVRRG